MSKSDRTDLFLETQMITINIPEEAVALICGLLLGVMFGVAI